MLHTQKAETLMRMNVLKTGCAILLQRQCLVNLSMKQAFKQRHLQQPGEVNS